MGRGNDGCQRATIVSEAPEAPTRTPRTHARTRAHTHTHLEMICPRLVLQIEQYIYLITEGNPTEPLATARPSVSPRQATPRQMDVNKVAIEEFIRLLPH